MSLFDINQGRVSLTRGTTLFFQLIAEAELGSQLALYLTVLSGVLFTLSSWVAI